jgi:hypothetical protein
MRDVGTGYARQTSRPMNLEQQNGKIVYYVKFSLVRLTIFAVEEQCLLHIRTVCVCP